MGIIKSIVKEVCRAGLGLAVSTLPALYPFWVKAPASFVKVVWPNIESREEADRILEEEKRALGIGEDVSLRIYEDDGLRETGVLGYSALDPKGEGYVIGVNRSDLDRLLLRHELYHIHKGDVTASAGRSKEEDLELLKRKNDINACCKYYFLQEPRAELYSFTGVRF